MSNDPHIHTNIDDIDYKVLKVNISTFKNKSKSSQYSVKSTGMQYVRQENYPVTIKEFTMPPYNVQLMQSDEHKTLANKKPYCTSY